MKPQSELNLTRVGAKTPDSIELLEAFLKMSQGMVGPVRLTVTIEESM
jgi:hypothetical protein